MGTILASLVLAGSAGAHSPHDVAEWVAVSPGPDPAWVATTVVRSYGWMLVRTADGGATLETRFVVQGSEEITAAAFLDRERLVLGFLEGGLWWSDDAGDTFAPHPDVASGATVGALAASPDILDDGLALAAGQDDDGGAIWRTTDGGDTWRRVASEPGLDLRDLRLSPDFPRDGRAFAVARDGTVLRSGDHGTTWSRGARVTSAPEQVAAGPHARVYLATAGGLWRSDDDGATFAPVAFEAEGRVTTVAVLPGGAVLCTLPEEAAWRSDDDGETWTLGDEGVQPAGGGVGNPTDGNHHFQLLPTGDGAVWLASWEGIARSGDGGLTWDPVETYLPEVVNDVALVRGPEGRILALGALNGGGMELVDLDLGAAAPVGEDLPRPWPRHVAATPGWASGGAAFATLSSGLAATQDGGVSWELVQEQRFAGAGDAAVCPGPDGERVLGAGLVDEAPGGCLSEDGGVTWACEPLGGTDMTCTAAAVAEAGAWLACGDGGHLFARTRAGGWTEVGAVAAEVQGLAAGPDGDPVYVASQEGLFVSRGGGAPGILAFQGEAVWRVAASSDPSDPAVFALVAGRGALRSDDGGETFSLLDLPTEAPATGVSLSPDFAGDGIVAVSAWDGAWRSTDRGETWEALHALEVVDAVHPLWRFQGAWADVDHGGAVGGADRVTAEAGDRAELTFWGVGVDLLCPRRPDGGTMAVRVDGASVGTVALAGAPAARETCLRVRGLEDGVHVLEVEVTQGAGAVDAAVAWRQDLDDLRVTAPGSRCDGCGTGGGGGGGMLALAAILPLARRRRRR